MLVACIYQQYWICKCDCGNPNIISVRQGHLIGLKTISCGCIQKEKVSKTSKKYNTYNLDGDFGIGYTSKGEEFWFDKEDYDKIKGYCWYYNPNYLQAYDTKTKKKILLHKFILDATENEIVDHINHDRYINQQKDNRKSNLRKVTTSQNAMNSVLSSNNTSGYKGVSYDKLRGQWVAYITKDKKQYLLGRFYNIEDAIKSRQEAEIKYFGEYRNKLLEE